MNQTLNKVQEEVKYFQCSLCSKTFAYSKQVKIHYSKVHKEKNIPDNQIADTEFRCENCKKEFSSNIHLRRHMKTVNCLLVHSKIKTFVCSVCKKTFSRSDNLQIHFERMHEKSKKFNCEKCSKSFAIKYLLKIHLERTHAKEKFECEICHKTFKNPYHHKQHFQRIHEKCFECKPCSTSYKSIGELMKHKQLNHDIKCKNTPKRKCKYCHREGSFKWLENHIDSVHLGIQHKCQHCEKSLKSKSSLYVHVKSTHTTEGKFKCEFCAKEFSTQPVFKSMMV